MKKAIIITASLCGLLAASSVLAFSFRGFYLGLDLGYSTVNYSNANLPAGFAAQSINDSGFAEKVFVGYNFNPFLATELSVIYFSKPKFNNLTFQGAAVPISVNDNLISNNSPQIKNNLISLVGKLTLPIFSTPFAVNGKLGIGYITRDGISAGNNASIHLLPEGEFFTPVYGLGATYHLTQRWVIDATWLQAAGINDKKLPASNYFGLGMFYCFGL